ncbi:MAG TPA: hypothetical protein VK979_05335 [Guyparkeria sp.]|nr:hypothetical protein [Guyparkeria sp.]
MKLNQIEKRVGETVITGYLVIIVTLIAAALSGCASTLTGSSYSQSEARAIQHVTYARVESVRPVHLEGGTGIGTGIGGIVGGLVGHELGDGNTLATTGGVLAGAAGGAVAQRAGTDAAGVEVTVQMPNGEHLAIVQAAEPGITFRPGERVRVTESCTSVDRRGRCDGSTYRVAH